MHLCNDMHCLTEKTHKQPFKGPLYQKKHSPTHTHPDYQTSSCLSEQRQIIYLIVDEMDLVDSYTPGAPRGHISFTKHTHM